MGFFDKYPYTNFHELNLDWLLSECKSLDNRVSDLENMKIPGIYFNERYICTTAGTQPETLYVSCLNGDDDLGDGTADNPVKTIEEGIRRLSQKHMDIRLVLLDDGTYPVNILTNTAHIHIRSAADSAKILLQRNWANYQCHLNLQGKDAAHKLEIDGDGYTFYFDNGAVELNYVNMNCDFRMYGGVVNFTNYNTIHQLIAISANIFFGSNVLVEDPVIDRAAFDLTNCMIYTNQPIHFNLSGDASVAFLKMYGCHFVMTAPPVNDSGYVYTRSDANLNTMFSTNTAYAAIEALATTNNIGGGNIKQWLL